MSRFFVLNHILVVLLALGGFSRQEDKPGSSETLEKSAPMTNYTPNSNSSLTYLALGDSYTIGEGVEERFRWPMQLQDKFDQNEIQLSEVQIIARTGWTTANLLKAIDKEQPKKHDLVSLLIGVNNQYQKLPFSQFEREFDSLLQISIDLASHKGKVFVVSIPDYGVTPFGSGKAQGIAEDINRYNAYIKQRCEAQKISYIEITEISRKLGDSEGSLVSDQLHPSANQYSQWVEKIYPIVLKQLQN